MREDASGSAWYGVSFSVFAMKEVGCGLAINCAILDGVHDPVTILGQLFSRDGIPESVGVVVEAFLRNVLTVNSIELADKSQQ